MRKLRIVGVDTESSVVECEVPDSGEKFSLPLDDRLRAAARGEFVSGGGSGRAPVTGTLRPREIQDRIRHGASPEEVAADAGVSLSRIQGFAVPVLLERANAADMARASHPVLPDGPALNTLADRVGAALDRRGVDPDLVTWDAWRDRSGGWVVRTSWPAGLSDDASATWSFVPDSHGGSARALDDEAENILDPSRATALRSVSSPPPLPPGPPPIRAVPAPTAAPATPAGSSTPAASAPPAGTGPVASGRSESTSGDSRATGERRGNGDDDDNDDFLQPTPTEPERRPSRRHPTMPSWEDVLLGVRGKDD
ncbi:septation protein SepH [Dietzia kunjamensis]|uniref:septation protein SepH n=1 Tax=Dietzia kunjamensis TaxID=322509 RepID=UPI002DB62E9B|nr:septation protein SepH [Dietzia kunjamensis]MEB8326131.1 septation protein SepH [Dietzia kunjamensis]